MIIILIVIALIFFSISKVSAQTTGPEYDEQIGLTFTQDWTSLSYNVTAIAQTDANGYGPDYLLNGLSNEGYWYQVGVSYNWVGSGYSNSGFQMGYNVFGPTCDVIYPSIGGGGGISFSGTVNSGDIITLSIYFDVNGNVTMLAKDINTGSYAFTSYYAYGATQFFGNSHYNYGVSNSCGEWTGLMTEWYHFNPYYGNEQTVTYIPHGSVPTSGILWIDEFQNNTKQPVFPEENSGVITSGTLSYEGAYASYSNGDFVTGGQSTSPPSSYTTNFYETGLPLNTRWSVYYNNILNTSLSNLISFTGISGPFLSTVPTVRIGYCNYTSNTQNVYVQAGSTEYITFTKTCEQNLTTSFFESGLPSYLKWKVTYNGIPESSGIGDSFINFTTAPGDYSYEITQFSLPNTSNGCNITYTPSPIGDYANAGSQIQIVFSTVQNCPGGPVIGSGSSFGIIDYSLAIGIPGAAIAAGLVFFIRSRRNKTSKTTSEPIKLKISNEETVSAPIIKSKPADLNKKLKLVNAKIELTKLKLKVNKIEGEIKNPLKRKKKR
jgi:hypothetical protein